MEKTERQTHVHIRLYVYISDSKIAPRTQIHLSTPEIEAGESLVTYGALDR